MVVKSINRNIVECKLSNGLLITAFSGVLIETLWNVNEEFAQFIAMYTRINRNIVECKYRFVQCLRCCLRRINRNIVECKYSISSTKSNLNPSINRNIVECKFS